MLLVMRFDGALIDALVSAGTKVLETHKSYASWAGALPYAAADDARGAAETLVDEEAAEAMTEDDGGLLDESQDVVEQGTPPLEFVSTILRSMYRRVNGGCVEHMYTPIATMSCLQLQGPRRPGTTGSCRRWLPRAHRGGPAAQSRRAAPRDRGRGRRARPAGRRRGPRGRGVRSPSTRARYPRRCGERSPTQDPSASAA